MYADDIALIDENRLMLEPKANLWKGTLENGDLKQNVSKAEYIDRGSPGLGQVVGGHGCGLRSALSRHTQECHVTEMTMLWWMCGVTRSDRIRNTFIRASLGIRDVVDKLQERRLRWYGHVGCWSKNNIGCKCLAMSVPGVGPPGCPRKR